MYKQNVSIRSQKLLCHAHFVHGRMYVGGAKPYYPVTRSGDRVMRTNTVGPTHMPYVIQPDVVGEETQKEEEMM